MIERHLAIDLGASSGRAIVGEVVGGRMTLTEVHRFENGLHRHNGHLCWDVSSLALNVVEGLRKADELGLRPQTVGIDTWAVDFVLVDRDGNLVGDAVGYRDSRTEGVRDALQAAGTLDFADQYARTGIQYQPFNTCYQLVALKAEHPDWLGRADALLMIPDYLGFVLTGKKAAEYTNASTTALVSAATRDWDDDLIARLGLPRGLFQPISQPGTVLGTLRPELVAQLGFDCEVMLPATHDTGSAWLAVPAKDEHAAYLSSGTWSLMGADLPRAITGPESMDANFTNEGGANGRFRYLKNIMGLWMIQNVRRECVRRDGTIPTWGELVAAAEEARAGGFRSVVNADDPRFLAPSSMSQAVRRACTETGQRVPATTGQLALTVYDSLAADYAQTVRELARLTKTTYDCVNVVGGGANNAYLNQATADACGLPVVAGPTEGTALGNLMVQFVHAGEFGSLAEARAAIPASFPLQEFRPRR